MLEIGVDALRRVLSMGSRSFAPEDQAKPMNGLCMRLLEFE
ncbi:hypothetical protein [Bradyrhizobium canariense]|nr:hypothetical protein [Bradyrhizobium canariense]